jgi:type IV secretory pathway VirB6-like protein
MKRLEEHLSYIYLSEDFSGFVTGIKNKFKSVFNAFRSNNPGKIKESLKDVPAAKNANEVVSLARNKLKGFDRYYNEGKRLTKGDNSEAKKLLSTTYATMKSISDNSDNPTVKRTFDERIKKFVEFLSDAPEASLAGGVTFVIGSEILKALMKGYEGQYNWFDTLTELGQAGGFLMIALGIVLVIIKYILLLYLKLKGIEVEQ